ncbi:MAG: MFS transporter, partial [Candidatus Thorarchaeota archaeon]
MTQSTFILEKQSNWKSSFLGLEATAYAFQGFYIVGIQIYATVYMASLWNLDFQTIALVTLIMGIPAFLKMFSGLISDRVWIGKWGRRKPFILLGTILYLPSFAFLISIQEFSILWLLSLAMAATAWMLVDSTLDALTVDITPEEEVSRMQGAAYGGRMLGVAMASIVVTQVAPIIGWGTMLLIIGVCAVIQSIAALLFRELPVSKEQLFSLPAAEVLRKTFGSGRIILGILFAMFFVAATSIVNMVGAYILSPTGLDWDNIVYGLQYYGYANLINSVMAAIGSFSFGLVAKKYITRKSFYWLVVLVMLLLHTPWLLVGPGVEPYLVFFAMATSGIGRGIAVVLIYSVVMRLCPDSFEGFAFATFSSFMNIGDLALGTNLLPYIANFFGMNVAFVL